MKEKKEKKQKEVKNYNCIKCGSGQTYVRIKDKQRCCRNCGFIEEIK
jgi:hypothetical protein